MDMLKNYMKYIKESVNTIIKPDPSGYSQILNRKINYSKEYNDNIKKSMMTIKENVTKEIIEKMKIDLIGRLILTKDENGYVKIIHIEDISLSKTGSDFYVNLIGNKDRKIKYVIGDLDKSEIFFIDDFMNFFEKNFFDKMISFFGKSLKTKTDGKFLRHITKMGLSHDKTNDYIIIGDENNTYALYYDRPIKIHDEKIKEIDPYGEENWEE